MSYTFTVTSSFDKTSQLSIRTMSEFKNAMECIKRNIIIKNVFKIPKSVKRKQTIYDSIFYRQWRYAPHNYLYP